MRVNPLKTCHGHIVSCIKINIIIISFFKGVSFVKLYISSGAYFIYILCIAAMSTVEENVLGCHENHVVM